MLERKAQALRRRGDGLRYAVCARERLVNVPDGVMALTAADIFA